MHHFADSSRREYRDEGRTIRAKIIKQYLNSVEDDV